ncbi:putative lipid II flippase FtsW [Bdellovibrionota bacterium FG-1]
MKNEAIISKSWSANFKNSKEGDTCPWPLPGQGVDLVLLLTVIAMVVFGLLMVYSSSFIYAQEKTGDGFAFIKKQLVFATLGFTALIAVCRVDYRRWAKWAYPGLALSVVLLALVFVPGLGTRVLGAQRWLKLGPLTFQPGELAKFAVIFFVARQLDRKQDRVHTLAAGVLAQFVVPLPAMLLLLFQPDFGTTVMITLVIFLLMFLAGVPKRYLASALVLAALVGTVLVLGSSYRRQRLMTFMDPWKDPGGKGFQILQSLVGLHQGGFWGVGLGNGKEKLFFLPEAHNDFIFSVIGEELGFLGILAVIVAYLVFIYRGLKIALKAHQQYEDRFGMLLAAGITLALGLQGFVNMAVVLGLLPTKGLTLPFISYGGSALLVDLFAVGVLLSVARGPQYPSRNLPAPSEASSG